MPNYQKARWGLSVVLIISAILCFTYCVGGEQGGMGGGNPFNSILQNNPGFFSSNYSDQSGSTNPFFKSGSILDQEGSWGTSAPLKGFDGDDFSLDNFEEYRMGHPISHESDVGDLRVYVDLSSTKVGKHTYYSGTVTINYINLNGQDKTTRYRSGDGSDARYNVWVLQAKYNNLYFHGFFQNEEPSKEGALILVIDRKTLIPVCDNKDCNNDPYLVGGSVWFMNFRTTLGGKDKNSCNNHDNDYVANYNANLAFGQERIDTLSQRDKKCWFINIGPYDCRTWKRGKGLNTYLRAEPYGRCYTKLGSFEGLDLAKAFNVSDIDYVPESVYLKNNNPAGRRIEFSKDHSKHPKYKKGAPYLNSKFVIYEP